MPVAIDLSVVLQLISGAALLGAGKMLLETSRTLAVHTEKHKRHDARLDRLEERVG